jgi:hypothetical protein
MLTIPCISKIAAQIQIIELTRNKTNKKEPDLRFKWPKVSDKLDPKE